MIVIQVVLIVMIVFIMARFLASRQKSHTEAWKKMLFSILMFLAVIAIAFPDSTDKLAHLVGVGRGADLLLYCLAIAFIFTQINNYLRLREEQARLVVLARKLALLEAQLRQQQKL